MNIVKKIIRDLVLRVLYWKGYTLTPLGTGSKKIKIENITEFYSLAKPILDQKRTTFRQDRLYTLWQGLRQVMDYKGDVAEVGVFQGGSAKFLATILKTNNKEDVTVHLFDTFEGMPDNLIKLDQRNKGGFGQTSLKLVKEYLSGFKNVKFYKGMVEEQSRFIKDNVFSFVHLDVDIYNSFKFCLDFFHERLLKGGIIVLDDYGFTTCLGAKLAIDEFLDAHKREYYFFHLDTGQGILVKI